MRCILEEIHRKGLGIQDWAALPPEWQFDSDELKAFSAKQLFPYQTRPLRSAMQLLHFFYQGSGHAYQEGEDPEMDNLRRRSLQSLYESVNGSVNRLDITPDEKTLPIYGVGGCDFDVEDGKIPFIHFINRMAFWMATGSGKSLVLVKMVQVLNRLMDANQIPRRNILIVSPTEHLREQLNGHIEEFNQFSGTHNVRLILHNLSDFATTRNQARLAQGQLVYHTRSDLLREEVSASAQNQLDYHHYDNDGEWYILMDEAHKGDSEDSKSKAILTSMSRRGFLFNFSATLVDDLDIATTVYNYNIREFIRDGHAKDVLLMQGNFSEFTTPDEYDDNYKMKIVLKSLMALTISKIGHGYVKAINEQLYPSHNPMLLVLGHTVKAADADVALFVRTLLEIASSPIPSEDWESTKQELREEITSNPALEFRDKEIILGEEVWDELTQEKMRKEIFNYSESGTIAIHEYGKDKAAEVTIGISGADPFACVRAEKVNGNWINEITGGNYDVTTSLSPKFPTTADHSSSVNILLGSKVFYEGWSSSRPTVINYIGVGKTKEARKYILQSMGRGVRIESLRNHRDRFNSTLLEVQQLCTESGIDSTDLTPQLLHQVETLFIFSTDYEVMEKLLDFAANPSGVLDQQPITGITVREIQDWMFMPTYSESETPLSHTNIGKFLISPEDMETITNFVGDVNDPRLLLAHFGDSKRWGNIQEFINQVQNPSDHFRREHDRSIARPTQIMKRFFEHLELHPQNLSGFKKVENEINHHNHISAKLAPAAIPNLQSKIEAIANPESDPYAVERARLEKLKNSKDPLEQLQGFKGLEHLPKYNVPESDKFVGDWIVNIRNHPNYLLNAMLYGDSTRTTSPEMRHIIDVESECHFIEKLVAETKCFDDEFDEWYFCKLDPFWDSKIKIPYHDPTNHKIRTFHPDFIFWLKKDNQVKILFVDPKGGAHTHYQHKLAGYQQLFEDNGTPLLTEKDGFHISVHLAFWCGAETQVSQQPAGVQDYWKDSIQDLVNSLKA